MRLSPSKRSSPIRPTVVWVPPAVARPTSSGGLGGGRWDPAPDVTAAGAVTKGVARPSTCPWGTAGADSAAGVGSRRGKSTLGALHTLAHDTDPWKGDAQVQRHLKRKTQSQAHSHNPIMHQVRVYADGDSRSCLRADPVDAVLKLQQAGYSMEQIREEIHSRFPGWDSVQQPGAAEEPHAMAEALGTFQERRLRTLQELRSQGL